MCGRIALYTPPARLARFFAAQLADDVDPDLAPSWNVGPTRDVLGVVDAAALRHPPAGATRVLDTYRWGLVPSWAPDLSAGSRQFNARAESVADRPAFRAAFERRRLLVVADGFYEWQKSAAGRPAFYFTRADGAPLAFAGLWEFWRDPGQPEAPWLRSCTIITTAGGPDIAAIHDRMPVVLEPDTWDRWLDPEASHPAELADLLAPSPPGTLDHHQVDRRVGNVRNDEPGLIAEVRTVQPSLLDP
jgi:putative SOS response-associated peptidase YedK